MLVPHTPRSSLEIRRSPDPLQPTSFLHLPAELRVEIYKLAFADIINRPYRIEYRTSTGWRVHHTKNFKDHPTWPSACLLQANRQIYFEARDVLHKICDGGPTLSVRYLCPLGIGCRPGRPVCVYDLLDVRKRVPPILGGARGVLTIEVVVPADPLQQAVTIAFVRWMRAVFNKSARRPAQLQGGDDASGSQLKELRVVFRSQEAPPGTGLYEVFRGWRCGRVFARCPWEGMQAWSVVPPLAMPAETEGSGRDEDENEAWKTCERMRQHDLVENGARKPGLLSKMFCRRHYVFTAFTIRASDSFGRTRGR